jgi:hypothetical protein
VGWASRYIARLQAGQTVSFRPHGNSMQGRIESGQLCTGSPFDPATLRVGDIVLCRIRIDAQIDSREVGYMSRAQELRD